LVAAAGLVAAPSGADAAQRLSMATGSAAGVYYLWGGAIAKIVNEKVPGVQLSVEATGGQTDNAMLVSSRRVELSMLNVDTLHEMWNGLAWAKGVKHDRVRALAGMYPSFLNIVTPEAKPIKTVRDMAGKNVGLGPPKGTPDTVGRMLMDALNIKVSKYHTVGWADTVGAVRDGIIDVVIAIGGQPWPPITDLETTHKLRFVQFSQDELDTILKKIPYYATGTVPKGTYKGLESDYKTLTFWNMIVTDKDLSEDLVYRITKAIFENADTIRTTHPSTAKYLAMESIAAAPVPVHPGAAKFYREKGVKLSEGK
jgi:hypothetical protein